MNKVSKKQNESQQLYIDQNNIPHDYSPSLDELIFLNSTVTPHRGPLHHANRNSGY